MFGIIHRVRLIEELLNERTLRVYEPGVSPEELKTKLFHHGMAIESIFKRGHSLEEHFINLVKGEEDVA